MRKYEWHEIENRGPEIVTGKTLICDLALFYIKGSNELFSGAVFNYYKSFFFFNGQIRSETNFKDGKYDGVYITYFENGEPSLIEMWKNNRRHGERTSYSRKGQIISIKNYKDGEKDGESVWYNERGILRGITVWKGGKRHGEEKQYNDNGRLRYTATWKDDVQQTINYHDN